MALKSDDAQSWSEGLDDIMDTRRPTVNPPKEIWPGDFGIKDYRKKGPYKTYRYLHADTVMEDMRELYDKLERSRDFVASHGPKSLSKEINNLLADVASKYPEVDELAINGIAIEPRDNPLDRIAAALERIADKGGFVRKEANSE